MASICTLLTLGQTGAGKSELGNAYLRDPNAFVANDFPDTATLFTSSQQRVIDGVTRCCIDTQGINDTEGVDTEHVQQVVQFLRGWTRGVNGIAIVINGQAPRLDAGTEKLIKIMNTFFNNPEFWDHTCLVFTKNYKGCSLDRNILENEYRQKVQDIIVQCTGNSLRRRPQLPVFLVDSKAYNNPEDISTRNDLAALHAFIVGLPPLPTQHVVAPDIRFMRIEPETRTNQLVNTRIEANGANGKVKTLTYEDQKREKRTAYDGVTVTYSDWVSTRRWDVKQQEKTEIETKSRMLVNEQKTNIFRTECGSRRYGLFGPRERYQVFDHLDITRTYNDQQRQVVTNFDGTISYGDWVVTRTYTEKA